MTRSIVDYAKTDPWSVFASLDLTGVHSTPDASFSNFMFDRYSTGSTGMAKSMRTQDVTSRVMEYFQSHPGKVINIQELQKATKLERHQIQNSITRLSNVLGFKVETLTRGQIWRWIPEEEAVNLTIVPEPEPEKVTEETVKVSDIQERNDLIMIEFLGIATNGDAIVRDVSDLKLYSMRGM